MKKSFVIEKIFLLLTCQTIKNNKMKIQEITDNRLRKEMIQLSQSLQKHTFARMAMMMLEEKGIFISYEEALNL